MRRELVKTERRRGLCSGTPGRQHRTNNSARLGVEVALAQGGIAVPGGRGTLWVSVGSYEPQRDGLARWPAVMQPGQRLRIPSRRSQQGRLLTSYYGIRCAQAL